MHILIFVYMQMDGKTKVQFTASPGSQTSKPEVVSFVNF